MDQDTPTIQVKKPTRTRRITPKTPVVTDTLSTTVPILPDSSPSSTTFIDLINKISGVQQEFERLQKDIEQLKQTWLKEQKNHEEEITIRNKQEELERKRVQEAYDYDFSRRRKMAEDEFNDQKFSWEKRLKENQEQIEKDKQELSDLRKLAASFEEERTNIVKLTQEEVKKELEEKFEIDKKLREQEFKAEKELLNLKLNNLEAENNKYAKEADNLKKALDEATHQVKDIAVKVIESGSSLTKSISPSDNQD